MGDLTENFSADEFACRCPNQNCLMKDGSRMDSGFIQALQIMRDVLKKPIKITSGLRCPDWNDHEGGKSDSSHLKGLAVDIECLDSRDRYQLVSLARSVFSRIGVAKTFIHIDQDESKVQEVMWVY